MPAGRGRVPLPRDPPRKGLGPGLHVFLGPRALTHLAAGCHFVICHSFYYFVVLNPHFIVFTIFSWHFSSLTRANLSRSILKTGGPVYLHASLDGGQPRAATSSCPGAGAGLSITRDVSASCEKLHRKMLGWGVPEARLSTKTGGNLQKLSDSTFSDSGK